MEEDYSCRRPIIYMGKDRVNGAYYFLGDKDGVGRFLKYTVYPMWCTGSMVGNFLELGADVPTEVLAEVMLFINGVVNYELIPAKRGRAEAIVRTEVRTGNKQKLATKQKGPSETSREIIPQTFSNETKNLERNGVPGNRDGGPLPSRDSQGVDLPSRSSRRRSPTSANVLGGSRDGLVVIEGSEANTVQTTNTKADQLLASEEPTRVKRGRGRPRKIRTPD